MNLRTISEAVEAYKERASAADAARLDFFESLFKIQQACADEVGVRVSDSLPSVADAEAAYARFEPLLDMAPAVIDAPRFAQTCQQISAHLAEHAGLDDAVSDALASFNWAEFVDKLNLELAGKNPPEFIEESLQGFESFGVDAGLSASIVMMVVSFALRAHIQPVAQALFSLVGKTAKNGSHLKPVNCPICGSPAALSHVAMATGIDGRDREQYCSMCGTAWPYDRMRCGVCGTDNPTRLHYFNVEGDEAHRLQNCDECGQYQRVFFEESLSIPVALEVEDVVMAKLDRIALDPRFRA